MAEHRKEEMGFRYLIWIVLRAVVAQNMQYFAYHFVNVFDTLNQPVIFIYLFINYTAATNCILIIHGLSNFEHMLGVVLQTRSSDGIRTHEPSR